MSPEEIKAQLEAAKAELDKARKEMEATQKELDELKKGGLKNVKISGSYKGFRFDDNHGRVRNQNGEICDTQKLMAAAADKESPDYAAAVAVLDWLISIEYGHLRKSK